MFNFFIKILLFITVNLFWVNNVYAYPQGDGSISLYNYHLDEYVEVKYKNKNRYEQKEIEKINYIMRSPDGKIAPISLKLIELLDNIQDHFKIRTIEIISAFRSPKYNKGLKDNGRKVANESLHIQAKAADIHVDEITENAIKDYVTLLKVGGVGFYPNYDFVHVDVGPIRKWGEKEGKTRKFVGVEINPNKAWKAITDKNIYFSNQEIKVELTNITYEKTKFCKNIWYEFFSNGKWEKHKLIEKKKGVHKIKSNESVEFIWKPKDVEYGKYRLVIFVDKKFKAPPVYSNEFYIKKY